MSQSTLRKAVVLVSGGMDSAVTIALAREQGYQVHALSVAYGQRHNSELAASDRVAKMLGAVEHKTVGIDLRSIGGSALTADSFHYQRRDLGDLGRRVFWDQRGHGRSQRGPGEVARRRRRSARGPQPGSPRRS